ncbi:receptor like protein kinase S.2-like [Bidens hawaiensis]|uniref:receptor like protein kinase S.2-like n=1 Tax=Bidens hawaiensis TaxID=980011 RepID=UPI0040490495
MEEKIIVYEHTKGNLNRYLKDISLSWTKRLNICIDIANGLKFLHEGGVGLDVVIHRNLKSSNILLTKDWKAKICGFEHALTYHTNKEIEYIINDTEGSPGYCDPLYWETHIITKESDIYSFGVILFEILCGRLACPKDFRDRSQFLDVLVKYKFQVARLNDIVFEGIKEQIEQQSLATFQRIAFQCLHKEREQRPIAGDVVLELQKALEFQEALQRNYKDTLQVPERLKIPLEVIRMATNNFDEKYNIGSGAYGAVYKAELNHHDIRSSLAMKVQNKDEYAKPPYTVAIKRIFSREDNQEKEVFLVELDVLSRCEHPNIVSLCGCCVEGSEMLLVYEYASNGSLDNYLESTDKKVNLTWAQRLKMCIDIAQGLNYLHTNMDEKRKIIHRDIKSANIVLGKNWEAKIADFGLSKLFPMNHQASTINTNIVAGTSVYLDPEYDRTGSLKRASDIYSFGVVLFEIFTGKVAYDPIYMKQKKRGLAPIARKHFEMGTLIKDMLDPNTMDDEAYELGLTLKLRPDHNSLNVFSRIAYQCGAKTQAERPTIEVVIKELNKALCFQENRLISLRISLEDIKMGVGNFSDSNCIMIGEYGMFYNGKVQYNNSHKEVVVKRFNRFGQEDGFLKEFEVLFKYRQENIISLVGYCKEMDERIIVYENASMGSLDMFLNDNRFTWIKRLKICIDIANGLKFIHGGQVGQDVEIHRDIKSSIILLTKDWKAKVCGFEHALTYTTNKEIEYVINDFAGTPGYCDPLYWETKFLTKESDIYSLGVILFEILCGRVACPEDFGDHSQFLGDLAKHYCQEAQLEEIVFEGIKDQIVGNSFTAFQRIAVQCLHEERKKRPSAADVVVQLQKALEFQEDYEIRKGKLRRAYKDILHQFSKSNEIYSTMRGKKDIYDILSKGILLKADKPITHVTKHTIWDLEQSDDEDYLSAPDNEDYYSQPEGECSHSNPNGEDYAP